MAAFASQADLKAKKISFRKLSANCYAFTAEGDPNTGVIIGDDGVMVVDAQATPVMAREVIRRIRRVTAKPIRYVVLSHYHAVRVLGASAYKAEQIIASRRTLGLIRERGKQDMASEIGRFPRLFRGAQSIPGLTWPTMVFKDDMSIMLGKLEVDPVWISSSAADPMAAHRAASASCRRNISVVCLLLLVGIVTGIAGGSLADLAPER